MKRGRVYNRIYSPQEWQQVNKKNKDIMEDFLTELKQQKKKATTIKQYANDIRIILIYILRELDNKYILECTKRDFRRISLWFTEDLQLSSARVNRLLSALRSMLDFCESDDDYEYETNVAKKIKGLPKEPVREIIFLTDEQVEKLKNELIRQGKYIQALALCLCYDSAGRRNEVLQVQKYNILEGNKTNIVTGKRGKKFPLIYFDWTKECAKLYLEQRGGDDIPELFVIGNVENKRVVAYDTFYQWFVDMAKLLSKIEGKEIQFNVHSLRHSALENMKNNTHYICKKLGRKDGFSIHELKVFAHHNDISTTDSYLKNSDEEMLANMFGLNL